MVWMEQFPRSHGNGRTSRVLRGVCRAAGGSAEGSERMLTSSTWMTLGTWASSCSSRHDFVLSESFRVALVTCTKHGMAELNLCLALPSLCLTIYERTHSYPSSSNNNLNNLSTMSRLPHQYGSLGSSPELAGTDPGTSPSNQLEYYQSNPQMSSPFSIS
jgi:hypothetical protein